MNVCPKGQKIGPNQKNSLFCKHFLTWFKYITIIKKMDKVGVAFFFSDLSEQLLLILDAVAVPIQIIVAGKALIEERRGLAALFAL